MLRRSLLTIAALAGTALTGCSGPSPADQGVQVVASAYPLAFVAQRIAGTHAQVVDLTRPGQEPHDLELTVQQTAQVAGADLVVYAKGFQPAVDAAVSATGPSRVVDAAATAGLEDGNPHFWLDPVRLGRVATAVEKQLAKADPRHARAYAADLSGLQQQLRALDAAYRRGLAHCRVATVVASHDAYSYLGRYGLRFVSVLGLSPDAEPSPAHLGQLRRLIEAQHITTVFTEPLASPAVADALAQDADVRTASLDPIEGLSDATASQDYLSLMRQNLQALRTAQECS